MIGPAKAIENVLEALLVEKGLREGFEPHDLPKPSFEGRTDLRDLHTFTIDPETAKDFDDAISVRAEGEGLRVWVHIADVSYFVPAGSPLDHGAAERANSVYVPGLVAPMLPHSIADDACSLRPNEDRLTVTVEVPFSAALEPGEPVFYRSVIRSNERLTYAQAEAILAGRESRAGACRSAPPDGSHLVGAAQTPFRPRRAPDREPRDQLRVRRQGRGGASVARVGADRPTP